MNTLRRTTEYRPCGGFMTRKAGGLRTSLPRVGADALELCLAGWSLPIHCQKSSSIAMPQASKNTLPVRYQRIQQTGASDRSSPH